jgi:predicted kinase
MSDRLPPCPTPPDWRIDWEALTGAYDWLRNLAGCPQDPVFHAEGDVLTHTKMVCEELVALSAWRERPEDERRVLFAAALLHDSAKPVCTRTDPDGRISSRGHSRRGAVLARRVLWRLGVPFVPREQVAALVRHHQVPYFLVDQADSQRRAITVSQTARCDLLALLAEADVRGRICPDQQRLLDNVALFAEICREEGCLTGPRRFASDHARFLYFRDERRHPDSEAYDDTRCEAVLLSGLPGSGKDHWLRENLPDRPTVTLDAVRAELGVDPADEQGAVIARAREMARDFLRAGRSFVWNATNLSRLLRTEVVNLFGAYKAAVRIVYLEVPAAVLFEQNRRRDARVPAAVMERLLDRWEVPDVTEAHRVEMVVREAPG